MPDVPPTDTTDQTDELAEWKARVTRRSDRPDLVEAVPWPTTLTPDPAPADGTAQ